MQRTVSTPTHDELVDAQFGHQAHRYVGSSVHASGADLQRIGRIASDVQIDAALDLGCGGGHVTYALSPHATRMVACDLSQGMLDAVAEEAVRRGLRNVEFERASAEQLPFGDGIFDLVVSRYSAHHWRDWEAGLREAARVVSASGRLVFVDVMAPNSAALDTHLQTIELLRDPSHVRDRGLAEWTAALGRAGLEPSSIEPFRLPLEFASWVERMSTPEVGCAAIRWLQRSASADVHRAFEINDAGDFVVDAVLIEARSQR